MLPFHRTRKQPGHIDEIANTLQPATFPALFSTMTLLSLTLAFYQFFCLNQFVLTPRKPPRNNEVVCVQHTQRR
jgi:hypothetical protein